MRAVTYNYSASARALFALVCLSSLLLVHVLAGTPQASPHLNSPRSPGAVIDFFSSAVASLEARRPGIIITPAATNPDNGAAEVVVEERDAGQHLHHPTREVVPFDERAKRLDGEKREERKLDDDDDLGPTTMLQLREPSALEEEGDGGVQERRSSSPSSPVMTSAAGPTVFGVSVYLIIAWLALLYLMFRTGSISSTSDAKNYADELRA